MGRDVINVSYGGKRLPRVSQGRQNIFLKSFNISHEIIKLIENLVNKVCFIIIIDFTVCSGIVMSLLHSI